MDYEQPTIKAPPPQPPGTTRSEQELPSVGLEPRLPLQPWEMEVFQAEFRRGASVAAWQQAAAARLQAGKTAAEAEAERSAASATDAGLPAASLPAAARAAHAARDVAQPAL